MEKLKEFLESFVALASMAQGIIDSGELETAETQDEMAVEMAELEKMAAGETDEKKEDGEDVEKLNDQPTTENPPNAETKAEDKIVDTLPEQTKEMIDEVAKLAAGVKASADAAKKESAAVRSESNKMIQKLAGVAKVQMEAVNKLSARISEQESIIEALLESKGITAEVLEGLNVEKTASPVIGNPQEIKKTLSDLLQAMGQPQVQEPVAKTNSDMRREATTNIVKMIQPNSPWASRAV